MHAQLRWDLHCSVTRDPQPQPIAGADIPIQAVVAGVPLTVKLVYTINYGPQSIMPMTAGAAGIISRVCNLKAVDHTAAVKYTAQTDICFLRKVTYFLMSSMPVQVALKSLGHGFFKMVNFDKQETSQIPESYPACLQGNFLLQYQHPASRQAIWSGGISQ